MNDRGSDQLPAGTQFGELRQITDARGAVLHLWRKNSPGAMPCGECYFSEVLPGVVKGWKRHRAQTQNMAVPVGRMKIVLFDDRVSSPTRGHVTILELGRPDHYRLLRIPPGIWYAFRCLSDVPALLANCPDLPHDPAEGEQLPLDEPSIPYRWETNQ
jgi:dTDP-4-dehydrorhamnose 3,5-epimerase